MKQEIYYLQRKYMNRFLRKSVIQIKETFTDLYNVFQDKELEHKWYYSWFNTLSSNLYGTEYEYIVGEIRDMWETYNQQEKPLDEWLGGWMLNRWDELSIAYFQSYMIYKIGGIIYEMKVIDELKSINKDIVETKTYVDHNYKIDVICNNIAIQIKNYDWSEFYGNQFVRKAKWYNKTNRYIWYGTDGCYEATIDVFNTIQWKKIDINKILEVKND